MPYIRIETSTAPSNPKSMLFRTSSFVAELIGKSEDWVMASIDTDRPMVFGGSNAPSAYVRLESVGLPRESCPDFSAQLCAFLEGELGVSAERIYLNFVDIDGATFGWNGKTLG